DDDAEYVGPRRDGPGDLDDRAIHWRVVTGHADLLRPVRAPVPVEQQAVAPQRRPNVKAAAVDGCCEADELAAAVETAHAKRRRVREKRRVAPQAVVIDKSLTVNCPVADADVRVEAREAVEPLLLLGADPVLRFDPGSRGPAPGVVADAGDERFVRVGVEIRFAVAETGFERPRPRMP